MDEEIAQKIAKFTKMGFLDGHALSVIDFMISHCDAGARCRAGLNLVLHPVDARFIPKPFAISAAFCVICFCCLSHRTSTGSCRGLAAPSSSHYCKDSDIKLVCNWSI
jgi:hypothetical protein